MVRVTLEHILWLAMATLLSACSPLASRPHRDPDTLVRVIEADAKGLDPQAVSDLASVRLAAEAFEGLTRMNAAGQAEPGLAQSWSVVQGGLTWTFTLRPGLHFSDGTPIDAPLFVKLLSRLRDPATASPHLGLFEAIESLSADGPTTVRIRLAHPFPALPVLLAHPAMAALPLHRKDWVNDRPLLSSGAYQVTEWTLNDHLTMKANPAWHDGRPAILAVEWRPVSDSLVALRQFQAGQVDVLSELPSARLPELRKSSPGQIRLAPYGGAYYFAFNTRRPPFDDVRVRTALSLAVERDWMADRLIATGVQPAWGIIPPGTTGLAAFKPVWAGWSRPRRLAEAARLLKQAGFGPDHPLEFEIRYNSDVDHRRCAVALAAMWKPLGVRASLLNSEASLHFASLKRGDFALARSGWIGDLPVPENYLAVHDSKSGPINYSGFHDILFEKALSHALTVADPQLRASAMRAAEARLISQSPILPLYFYVSKSMVSPRVSGWQDNLANIHPSRTLALK